MVNGNLNESTHGQELQSGGAAPAVVHPRCRLAHRTCAGCLQGQQEGTSVMSVVTISTGESKGRQKRREFSFRSRIRHQNSCVKDLIKVCQFPPQPRRAEVIENDSPMRGKPTYYCLLGSLGHSESYPEKHEFFSVQPQAPNF